MNIQNDITDDDFVPFLQSLGVDTYNKSFEWMLNDPDYSGVLRWLYKNLDHNNALTARETYRYAELEKEGRLLSQEELDNTILSIEHEYPGILPGDNKAEEDIEFDIKCQKEKLSFLEKQERIMQDLMGQKELINQELNVELAEINSLQQQFKDLETSAADECCNLAEDLETITEGVVDMVASSLEAYRQCHLDKEIARQFLIFGPLESYRQSQVLFKMHFGLFTTKYFNKQQNDTIDDDLRTALAEAKGLEERLSESMSKYIETKVQLAGEQAKIYLVANYSPVHASQITNHSVEAQTALQLLMQEETILDQEIQSSIREQVKSRTCLAYETAIKSAVALREKIHTDLSHLLDTTHQALALDRVLYCALRHELSTVVDFLQFASLLRQYILVEDEAVTSRIESMNEITSEQEACERRLRSNDRLVHTMYSVLGSRDPGDGTHLVRLYADLMKKIQELQGEVNDESRKKEHTLTQFKKSLQPLVDNIYSGSTRQPSRGDVTVTALRHELARRVRQLDERVLQVGARYNAVRNGDKQNLRKLWQWFLTDEKRLMAAVKAPATTYS